MDKKEIRRQILLDNLDWVSLTPLFLGVTAALGAWAVQLNPRICFSLAIIPMLISAGIYSQRLFLGWDEKMESIARREREKNIREREEKLNQLGEALKGDGDPRTENLLKDLRVLTQAMLGNPQESSAMKAYDIIADVDKLFQRCVDYLKESLELWTTARNLDHVATREQLLKQRESLIDEVEVSLENLGRVLGIMKKADVNGQDKIHMDELREELNARLKMAETIESKMESMRKHVKSTDEDEYLRYANH